MTLSSSCRQQIRHESPSRLSYSVEYRSSALKTVELQRQEVQAQRVAATDSLPHPPMHQTHQTMERLPIKLLSTAVRSLVLTGFLAFLAPILLIGGLMLGAQAVALVPGLQSLGQAGSRPIIEFLEIFGNGSAYQGLMLIGAVCGTVGMLFDVYNVYRHHNLRDLRGR